jgi:hypothetical protein
MCGRRLNALFIINLVLKEEKQFAKWLASE